MARGRGVASPQDKEAMRLISKKLYWSKSKSNKLNFHEEQESQPALSLAISKETPCLS